MAKVIFIGPNGPQVLGPTDEYPDGMLNQEDEGELQIAVGPKGGKVAILFGKPVAWIAMTPSQAFKLSADLFNLASSMDDTFGTTGN